MNETQRGGLWAAVAVVLAAAGIVVNLVRPLAPRLGRDPVPYEVFSDEVLAAVTSYREPRLWVAMFVLLLGVLVPVLVVALPRTRRWLLALLERRIPGPAWLADPVRGAAVGAVVVLLARLATLPLSFWAGHVHEVQWGFRTAGAVDWFRDWGIGLAFEVLVSAVAAGLFVALWRRWPKDWPWRLVVVATVLSGVLVLLQPVVLQPLLLTTSPLPEGPVRDRLEEVVEASGIEAELTVGDASRRTTKVNAFVTGLGPTRQVVLWDTLLERPVDEVAAVVAHELAHRDHRDLPRGVLLGAAGLLPFALVLRRSLGAAWTRKRLGPLAAGDPRGVLVLVVVAAIAQAVALPPAMWASRRAEAAADARAQVLTEDPGPMIATFRGFVIRDLSQPAPPAVLMAFFGSHPSVEQRIRAVVEQARRDGQDLPDLGSLVAEERDALHPRIRSPR